MVVLVCFKMEEMLSLLELPRKRIAPPSGHLSGGPDYFLELSDAQLVTENISWWYAFVSHGTSTDKQDHLTVLQSA